MDDGAFANFTPVTPGTSALFRSRDTQTMFGPIVASFAIRAPVDAPTVVAEIVDAAAGTVLASSTITPDWRGTATR